MTEQGADASAISFEAKVYANWRRPMKAIHARAALALVAALFILTPAATADLVKPVVTLGPTTVLDGTAVVTGTLGPPASDARLAINGAPVSVDAAGAFAATIHLGGASRLDLVLSNSRGETTTTSIPLTTNILGPGGVISPNVLADLERAAVSLLKPPEGFKIMDGLPLKVEGSVLDKGKLAGLKLNGVDLLARLDIDDTFSVTVPGTTKVMTISATDQRGVSQETQVPVQQGTIPTTPSTAAPVAARTVEANQAVGLRIARVRYVLRGVKRTQRLRVIVTVKDRRGLLVRNASVGVRSAKAGWIRRNPKAKRTTRLGQAAFVLAARQRTFGRRLRLVIVAKTPHAKARKGSSVRLPRRG
jgi:hypothetical protein